MSPIAVVLGIGLALAGPGQALAEPLACDLQRGLATGRLAIEGAAESGWIGDDDGYLRVVAAEAEATVQWTPAAIPAGPLRLTLVAMSAGGATRARIGLAVADPRRGPERDLWLDGSFRTYRFVVYPPSELPGAAVALHTAPGAAIHIRTLQLEPMAGLGRGAAPTAAVRNASFEFGHAGWTPAAPEPGAPEIRPSEGVGGSACALLSGGPGTQPYAYATYPIPLVVTPPASTLSPESPVALTPGADYAIGLALRAEPAGTRVIVRVEQPWEDPQEARLVASVSWRPHQVTFAALRSQATITLAPVVEPTQGIVRVWVDDVSVSPAGAGPAPPSLEPDWACAPSRAGGVYTASEPVAVRLSARCQGDGKPRELRLRVKVEDIGGKPVIDTTESLLVPSDGKVLEKTLPLGVLGLGFFRVLVSDANGATQELRIARFEPYTGADSPFGVSWGWATDEPFRVGRAAGIRWVRDWSIAWEACEPQQGQRSLLGAAAFLDRYRRLDLKVLECLPFPSAPWSNGVPAEEWQSDRVLPWPGRRAYLPDQPELLSAHLSEFARELGTRFDAFEMLTEPLAAGWSLPPSRYGASDYVDLCRLARNALAEGGWGGEFVGGVDVVPGRVDPELYGELRSAGLHSVVGPMGLHGYLLSLPAEAFAERVRAAADLAGHPRIWVTECGLSGDDDAPFGSVGQIPSELDAADTLVRSVAASLSEGVERVFFVTGQPIGGWQQSRRGDFLFTAHGAPRKALPVLAALARHLGDAPTAAGSLVLGEARAYVFGGYTGAVAIVCPDYGASATLPTGLAKAGATVTDINGNVLDAAPEGDLCFYIRAPKMTGAELLRTLTPQPEKPRPTAPARGTDSASAPGSSPSPAR